MTAVGLGTGRRRLDLQALRALAVVAVVINHSWPGLAPGGYLGVDVFFVVSGYLITRQLVTEYEGSGGIRLSRFYLRRARRLLPAAALVLVAVSVMTLLVVPHRQWGAFFTQIGASTLYVQNWALLAPAAGPDVDTAVRHFWSLSVEEQFYLAWPLIILGGAALALRLGRSPRRVLLVGALTIVVVSFGAWVAIGAVDYAAAYFGTGTRAWQFAAGGLVALLPAVRPRGAVAAVVFWSGLAALVASLLLFEGNPGAAAIVPVAGTIAIMLAGMDGPAPTTAWLVGLRPVQWTGDISYALYLWHWPVLLFAPFATGVPSTTPFMVVLLAATVALSWSTTRFVENPIRRTPLEGAAFRGRRRWSATVVTAALAGTLVLAVGGSVDSPQKVDRACLERGVGAPVLRWVDRV